MKKIALVAVMLASLSVACWAGEEITTTATINQKELYPEVQPFFAKFSPGKWSNGFPDLRIESQDGIETVIEDKYLNIPFGSDRLTEQTEVKIICDFSQGSNEGHLKVSFVSSYNALDRHTLDILLQCVALSKKQIKKKIDDLAQRMAAEKHQSIDLKDTDEYRQDVAIARFRQLKLNEQELTQMRLHYLAMSRFTGDWRWEKLQSIDSKISHNYNEMQSTLIEYQNAGGDYDSLKKALGVK